jgi:hypothetical protein
MTSARRLWTRRTTGIAMIVAAAVAIPSVLVTANAVGRPPVGAGPLPAAQAPSHFAAVASKRAGARDSMTPAASAAAINVQRVQMQRAMVEFTTESPETTDMRGVEPSLYQGEFFDPKSEQIRQCIVKRESEGQYDVRGGGGNRYYGAYQMSDALADGATHMMLKEHKKILGEKAAQSLMKELRATPLNEWPRYWQDAAFSTVFNWESPGSGASPWAGGRWHC